MNESLWLLIEEKVRSLPAGDLTDDRLESTVQRLAAELDEAGVNVSRHAGNMLALRGALGARVTAGHPLLDDLDAALASLGLEDVANVWQATNRVVEILGKTWPPMKDSARRPDVTRFVEERRLELLVAKARSLSEDEGIRYLIAAAVDDGLISEALGITDERLAEVHAAVEAERAERERVERLLAELDGRTEEERIRRLLTDHVADELILEMAGVGVEALQRMKEAMEAELQEQKRREEEEEARRAAEAAGPSLDEIEPEEMLEHIESIREILEFSDVENEIRTMCEQSAIPKALVDIAVTDPSKLDELEARAGG